MPSAISWLHCTASRILVSASRTLARSSLQRNSNLHRIKQLPSRQFFSSTPPPTREIPTGLRARLQKFNDRLPAYLRSYTTPLLGAPATHVTSFLILHEITAVVPLFGLFSIFHYAGWTPLLSTGEDNSTLNEAVQRYGKWMTKKGWVGSEDVEVAKTVSASATSEDGRTTISTQQKGAQLVIQFATAYVVTKALLPVRIVASVWATPWFARTLLGPIGRSVKNIFQRKSP